MYSNMLASKQSVDPPIGTRVFDWTIKNWFIVSESFRSGDKAVFSQRRGQINIILVNCFVLTRITDYISLHKICHVLQLGHVTSAATLPLQTSGSINMWKYDIYLLYILKCWFYPQSLWIKSFLKFNKECS